VWTVLSFVPDDACTVQDDVHACQTCPWDACIHKHGSRHDQHTAYLLTYYISRLLPQSGRKLATKIKTVKRLGRVFTAVSCCLQQVAVNTTSVAKVTASSGQVSAPSGTCCCCMMGFLRQPGLITEIRYCNHRPVTFCHQKHFPWLKRTKRPHSATNSRFSEAAVPATGRKQKRGEIGHFEYIRVC